MSVATPFQLENYLTTRMNQLFLEGKHQTLEYIVLDTCRLVLGVQEDVEGMQRQIDELEETVKYTEQETEKAEAKRDELESDLHDAEEEIARLEGELEDAQKENAELRAQIQAYGLQNHPG